MRIGVYGGTFDPPHLGHLGLAQAAVQALELDELIFIPANRNPAKRYKKQASGRDRLRMVSLMTSGQPKMAVSDLEIARGGTSYAVETLDELSYLRPADYWFLLGGDALRGIETWKKPEKLLRLCRLGVAVRAPETWEDIVSRIRPEFRERLDPVPMTPVEISSTEIRDRLESGLSVKPWLDPAVLKYIRENHLYGS